MSPDVLIVLSWGYDRITPLQNSFRNEISTTNWCPSDLSQQKFKQKWKKEKLFSIKRQNTLKCEIILQFNSNDSHEYCLYFQYMASATLEGRVNAIHVLGIQKTVLISPTLALYLSPLCIAIGLKVLWSFSKLPHWVQLTTKHKGTSLNSSSIRSWRLLSNGLQTFAVNQSHYREIERTCLLRHG